MSRRSHRGRCRAVSVLLLALSACGGGGGSSDHDQGPAPAVLHVGGVLRGLSGGEVVVEITGGERLTLTGDGPFAFATGFPPGAPYAVTVVAAPDRAITTVHRGSGVLEHDVDDVEVVLEPGFRVAGRVTGSHGRVVLALNDAEQVEVDGGGPFAFRTLLRDGDDYEVTVVEAPDNERWSLVGASGKVEGEDVDGVVVDCVRLSTIGGTVRGLQGELILAQGGEQLRVTADGPFRFHVPVVEGDPYAVQVVRAPASQRVALRNAAGTAAGAEVIDVEVECTAKTWTFPASLDDAVSMEGDDADGLGLACAAWGDAILAFEYGSRIFTSERRLGVWHHPVRDVTPPHNPAGGHSFEPQAAFLANGDAVLLWAQLDPTVEQIYAADRRAGAWHDPTDHAEYLNPPAGDAHRPRVVSVGDAVVAAWEQYVGGQGRIFVAEYRAGTWTTPATPDDGISPGTTHAQDVQIAASPDGTVLVVWSLYDGANYRIFKSERRAGTWTHPASLADSISPPGTDAFAPAAAFDGAGDAIVVWLQSDGTTPQAFKAEHRQGAWRLPATLADHVSPAGSAVHAVAVAAAENGDAVIVWRQDLDGGATGLLCSERRAGEWHHPAGVQEAFSVGSTLRDFALAVDREGNTVVAYAAADSSGPFALFVSEYRAGAWRHPASFAERVSPVGGDVAHPVLAVDGSDDVVLAWQQHDGAWRRAFLAEYR
ncbi:MAG TPA: hypothetical protein VK081_08220 [Planctomycetota bacterium]|nr:hypothetical protein [Planctomycetota bacterium]